MNHELPLPPVEGITSFWTRVRKAKRCFLVLDYDGTLAPFKIARMEARPFPGTAELLTMIASATDTRLAVISGRPLSELVELLGPLPIEMVGAHGFEFRNIHGRIRRTLPDGFQVEGLETAQQRALAAGQESRIERKVASVAFHTRGNPDEADVSELARRLWLPVAEKYGLELKDFNGGVELRATGVNKGTALLEMLLSEPDHTLVVYIGDDETDEDAFRAIYGRGMGIKVGGYGIRTAAGGRLPHSEAVLDFLRAWYRVTRSR